MSFYILLFLGLPHKTVTSCRQIDCDNNYPVNNIYPGKYSMYKQNLVPQEFRPKLPLHTYLSREIFSHTLSMANIYRSRQVSANRLSYVYDLALRSHSIKHSRTSIRAWTIPRFKRSDEVLLPEYVGRISFPISSMTARSWAYLLCGSWWCCFGMAC